MRNRRNVVVATLLALVAVIAFLLYNELTDSDEEVVREITVVTQTTTQQQETTQVEQVSLQASEQQEATQAEQASSQVVQQQEATQAEQASSQVVQQQEATQAEQASSQVVQQQEATQAEQASSQVSQEEETTPPTEETSTSETRVFSTVTLQNGDVIGTDTHPDVYRVMYVGDESFKWLMLNPDILLSYTTFDQIKAVSLDVLEAHETSNFGVEVDADGNPTTGLIYFFTSQPNSDVGTKHLVVLTDEQWEELGLNKNSVFKINSTEFNSPDYVEGENITVENIQDFNQDTALKTGDVIGTDTHPDVYRVMYVGDESFKWLMLNPDILLSYTTFDQIKAVSLDVLEAHETSNFGVEVDADGNPTTGLIYFFTSQPNSDVGTKHLVVLTDEQWEELGLNKNSVFKINSTEFNSPDYVEGENITVENIHDFNQDTTLQNGDVIGTDTHPDVYRVMYVGDESFKWLMLNPDILLSYTTFDQIKAVSLDVLEAHETSNFGVEVDADGNPTTGLIYFFTSQPNSDVGTKHLVVLTDEQWEELGLNKNSVFKINSTEFNSPDYVEGENITVENIHAFNQ